MPRSSRWTTKLSAFRPLAASVDLCLSQNLVPAIWERLRIAQHQMRCDSLFSAPKSLEGPSCLAITSPHSNLTEILPFVYDSQIDLGHAGDQLDILAPAGFPFVGIVCQICRIWQRTPSASTRGLAPATGFDFHGRRFRRRSCGRCKYQCYRRPDELRLERRHKPVRPASSGPRRVGVRPRG
jgi:hypothetical protein